MPTLQQVNAARQLSGSRPINQDMGSGFRQRQIFLESEDPTKLRAEDFAQPQTPQAPQPARKSALDNFINELMVKLGLRQRKFVSPQ